MNDFIVAMLAVAAANEADRIDTYNELNDIDTHTDVEHNANSFWYDAMMKNSFMKSAN